MNRAFLIILVPALLVVTGYVAVSTHFGTPLTWRRFLMASGGFLVAVVFVYLYQRRKARPPRP